MKCPSCSTENPPTSRFCADCGTSLTPLSEPAKTSDTQTLPPFYELETGTIFADRYRIIEKIGAGGMGIIYKAYDTKIQEKVALKLIRPEISGDKRNITLFRNEIRVARQVSHKNICRMYDLGEFSETVFFTMELVPGENLKSILKMTNPLSFKTAVHYARQVCEGLAEAHKKLVHRDLKPQNIMVDSTGTVRIMDFGIARSVLSSGGTSPGLPIGTPEYMSPEQAMGMSVDARTDIYSLGVVLYEMVTGKVPFEGETALEILRKHEIEPPRPSKDWNPQVPEDLDRLIMKCLEKSKEKRYQDVAELCRELGEIETALLEAPGTGPTTKLGTSHGTETPVTPGPEPKNRWGQVLKYGLVLAGLAIAGYVLYGIIFPPIQEDKRPGGSPSPPGPVRIAVLPFDLKSSDPSKAMLCAGLTETVSDGLRKAHLTVKGHNTSKSIKEAADRSKALREAHVDLYIEATAIIENGVFSIPVYLIDARDDTHLWSETYNGNVEELFPDYASMISADLARELRQPLGEDQTQALRKLIPSSLESGIAYRRGIDARERYDQSGREEDFLKARGFFDQVFKLEPDFSLAYLAMGVLYEGRYVNTEDQSDLKEMVRYFGEALKRNPSVPQIQAGMGWAYFHKKQFESAYESFKNALRLDPTDEIANIWTASFLRSIGLDEPALRHYIMAIEQNPLEYSSYTLSAVSYQNLCEYESAAMQCESALKLLSNDPATLFSYVRTLIAMNRLDEAEQKLEQLGKLGFSGVGYQAGIRTRRALILAIRGMKDEALRLIEGVDKPYRLEITNIHAILGLKDEAIENIKKGNEQGFELIQDYMYPYPYLMKNPFFQNLRGDPRFEEIVRNEKAKYDEKMKKFGDL